MELYSYPIGRKQFHTRLWSMRHTSTRHQPHADTHTSKALQAYRRAYSMPLPPVCSSDCSISSRTRTTSIVIWSTLSPTKRSAFATAVARATCAPHPGAGVSCTVTVSLVVTTSVQVARVDGEGCVAVAVAVRRAATTAANAWGCRGGHYCWQQQHPSKKANE